MATESNHSNNSEYRESGGMTYAEMLDKELREEAFSDNPDMERIAYLSKELSKVDPPTDKGAYRTYEEFCKLHNITIVSGKKQKKHKKIFLIAAVISVLLLSSVVVIGNKFNLFELTFNDSDNKVNYSQQSETNNDKTNNTAQISEQITVHSVEEAQRIIPFALIVPKKLPDKYSVENITVTNHANAVVQVGITYTGEDADSDLSLYAEYTSSGEPAKGSQQYEDDYKFEDSINIMGQEAMIISDEYNNTVCTFAFDRTIYTFIASQNLSKTEFREILSSMDFAEGE